MRTGRVACPGSPHAEVAWQRHSLFSSVTPGTTGSRLAAVATLPLCCLPAQHSSSTCLALLARLCMHLHLPAHVLCQLWPCPALCPLPCLLLYYTATSLPVRLVLLAGLVVEHLQALAVAHRQQRPARDALLNGGDHLVLAPLEKHALMGWDCGCLAGDVNTAVCLKGVMGAGRWAVGGCHTAEGTPPPTASHHRLATVPHAAPQTTLLVRMSEISEPPVVVSTTPERSILGLAVAGRGLEEGWRGGTGESRISKQRES